VALYNFTLALDLLSFDDSPLSIYLLNVVIVDSTAKEQLIFGSRVGGKQSLFGFGVGAALRYQKPETGVVQIVDVAVSLPPPEVVFELFLSGVAHYS
jgi:hypothetical protein